MNKLYRTLLLSVLVVALLGASVPSASAKTPPSITVMTQNLYQGTEFTNSLAATNQTQFLLGVAADYNNVIATNFPQRADAIATEIAANGPALVALQEVALFQTSPVNAYGLPTGPWTTTYDFLQIMLNSLSTHGLHYTTVIAHSNYTVTGVGLFSTGLLGVSMTDRTTILARTDLSTSQLQTANPQQGSYQAAIMINACCGISVTIGGGWLSVDATTQGSTFRFITTHLSAITLTQGVQTQQMTELLSATGPVATTTLPILFAGDFNTDPTGQAYSEAAGAGFIDTWNEANGDAGYTAFQVLPTINNANSNLSTRIDYILDRGSFAPQHLSLVGADPSARTSSGLWPSDHAGVVGTFKVGGS